MDKIRKALLQVLAAIAAGVLTGLLIVAVSYAV